MPPGFIWFLYRIRGNGYLIAASCQEKKPLSPGLKLINPHPFPPLSEACDELSRAGEGAGEGDFSFFVVPQREKAKY
jgi:hypothetical protein